MDLKHLSADAACLIRASTTLPYPGPLQSATWQPTPTKWTGFRGGAAFQQPLNAEQLGGGALVTLLVVKFKSAFFKLLWTISAGC